MPKKAKEEVKSEGNMDLISVYTLYTYNILQPWQY